MNLKYVLKDGTHLMQTCGGDSKKYKMCQWLIKNKGLTPDEALAWKHTPAREDQKTRRLECQRRFLGYSEDELHISHEEAKLKGLIKRGTQFYKGKTISQLAKEYNIGRGALYYRIKKLGMLWKDAVSYPTIQQQVVQYKGENIYKLFDKKTAHRITNRVKRLGWGIDLAVECPVCDKGESAKWVKMKMNW